jgi:hypothetical protein
MISIEQQIADEAFKAAKEAEAKFIAEHGEMAYCGFAWVKVYPGNCRMAKYLKNNKLGDTGIYGGVEVWNPGKSGTQSMDVKEAGAKAFAEVLRGYGIKAAAMSRPD